MTNRQEDELTMITTVEDFESEYSEISNTLPNYPTYFTDLQKIHRKIKLSAEKQLEDKKGLAETKNDLKYNLAKLAANTASKITAYAQKKGDNVLKAEVNITESKMKKAPDTTLLNYVKNIYKKADGLKKELKPY